MKVLKYVGIAALFAWAVIATIFATKYSEDLSIEKYYHESTSKRLERSYEDYEELEVAYDELKEDYDEIKYQSLYDDALNDATNTTTLFRGIAFEVLFKWVCSVANNEEFDIEKELGVLAEQHEISISEQKVILLFIQQELEKNFINT